MFYFSNSDAPCISTGALRTRVNFFPPLDPQTEEQFTAVFRQAGIIVSGMELKQTTITALLQGLKQNLTELEKDLLRDELKREILTALEDGGIPPGMIYTLMMVFVDLIIKGIVLVHAKRGASIILYLKCGSVESLLSLRDMIVSGLLQRLLSDAIKQFIQTQPRIHLLVKQDDFNLSLFYLRTVTGTFVDLMLSAAEFET